VDLAGVTVLDLSIWRPGPYATQLLAERGAEVTKVEPPGGDPMRAYGELFQQLNARKVLITLDLKDDGDRARALELAAGADVVVEGFRPGVVARLGVDYPAVRAVNADVVYCSVSGMGQTGPLANAPGHDLNYLAWAGALAPEGGEPRWPALPIADLAGGMAAALEISTALVRRARTGEGRYIDIAMADVVATWTGWASSKATNVDTDLRGAPGYGVFASVDGYVTIAVVTEDHFWRGLCDVLALSGERDLSFAERLPRLTELQEAIASAVSTRPTDELIRQLLDAGVPAAPVLDRAGMLALDHFRARGLFSE
jgi:crotonobetainyl-CoA:carnitine CoA-transferase CaiB-like acyl-CoA transferase